MMEERIRATEEAVKRTAMDEFLKDFRVEERSYVRETKSLDSATRSMVMQERLFFRNIPLSNWVEHEMIVEQGKDLNRLQEATSIFTAGSLNAGMPTGLSTGSHTGDGRLPISKLLDNPARWVTRIAVNTCLDRLRSRRWLFWRKRPSQQDEQVILRLASSARPEAEDRYFAGQIRDRLESALERLSPRQRAAFTLRHYDDLSLEEIGNLLDLDIGTVKAHMHRAMVKL